MERDMEKQREWKNEGRNEREAETEWPRDYNVNTIKMCTITS